jgi:hypothetical protein
MSKQVLEVLGRSTQGQTGACICRCDGGGIYYVKGRGATKIGLLHEWLCGHLALAMGLPIAPFEIAEVPHELVAADLSGSLDSVGEGPAFASRKVLGQELALAQVPEIDLTLRRDVLVFDWWIRNCDRSLTKHGGNVNLLWQPGALLKSSDEVPLVKGPLAMIDHNLAFDPSFDTQSFCETHVFAADIADTFSDFELRDAYAARLKTALACLDEAWNNAPFAWQFVDLEQTVPTNYPKAAVWTCLHRIESADFWNLRV